MAQDMAVLTMFIASPGGVDEERDAAELAAEKISAGFGAKYNAVVLSRRYELLIGAAGNPQAQINAHAEDCDVFVGIVHRRWGSPTGNGFDSGFHEEFTRNLERWKRTGRPRIGLFFKDVDREAVEDAGPQLQRVLEFRATIEKTHAAFYNRFSSPSELGGLITTMLAEEIAAITGPTPTEAGNQGARPGEPTTADKAPRTREPISTELSSLMADFAAALAGDDYEGPLDVDRLELFALGLSRSDDPVPTHLANRLFLNRTSFTLIGSEQWIWFLQYLRDVGKAAAREYRVIPFPSVVGREWIESALQTRAAHLLGDDEHEVRLGTLRLLSALQIRPKEVWPAAGSNDAGRLVEIWRPFAQMMAFEEVIEYWLRVRKKGDRQRARLLSSEDDRLVRLLGNGLEGLLSKSPRVDALIEADASLLLTDSVRGLFSERAPERTLPDEALVAIIERSYLSDALRSMALAELVRRDRVPQPILAKAIRPDGSARWGRLLDTALLDVVLPAGLLASVVAALSTWDPKSDHTSKERRREILARVARNNAALDEQFDALEPTFSAFDDDIARWQFVRHQGDPRLRDQARQVITDTHAGLTSLIELLKTAGLKSDVIDFMRERLELAALEYLLSLDHPADVKLVSARVRQRANDDGNPVQRDAIKLLTQVAQDRDIDLIASKAYLLDDSDVVLSRTLERATLVRLRGLAAGKNEVLAVLALRELSRRARPLAESALAHLLRSELTTVRMAALDQLLETTTSDLGSLLDGYARGKGTHFYNVICEIDRRMAEMPI